MEEDDEALGLGRRERVQAYAFSPATFMSDYQGLDPFTAEIRIFAFGSAPDGWAACDGRVMPIMQNSQLFSLLRTTYGGDGQSTFALPSLAGAAPLILCIALEGEYPQRP